MSLAEFMPPRRSLLSRIFPRFAPAPAPTPVTVLQYADVLNDEDLLARPDLLALGFYPDGNSRCLVDDVALVRHTAVYGGAGFGQLLAVQYLLLQQLGRGGGFLFVDENECEQVAGGLEKAASGLGIPFTTVATSAGYASPYGLVGAVHHWSKSSISLTTSS